MRSIYLLRQTIKINILRFTDKEFTEKITQLKF